MTSPSLWFVPSEPAMHPETREVVLEVGVAYSIAAFQATCEETGLDYVDGRLMTLDCARFMRRNDKITRFVLRQFEA